MRFTPFVHTRQWLVVRAMALSGIILLFMVPVGNLTWAPLAHAQTNSVVDHRIIIGAYGSQGYCYDWQDSGEGYGPGCWHQDEGSQWDAIDVSGPGIGEGTNVYHQEYGVQGSVALWVTAINRCGQYDTGTNCNGGTGCSYVYVQMRDINTGAPIGEEHYLHIVPQASLGYVGQANYGWTSFAIGYLAANQPNSCSFKGAHLHQSGSKVYPSQVTNHNIGAGAGDPPSGCGGAIPQFLCISPFGDTDYHWLHAIEEGTPAAPAYWMTLPGGVLDAAIGKEGSTWVLGTASAGNGYQVFHVNGSGYQLIDGAAMRIAVGPDATLYGTRADGSIWRRIGGVSGVWQQMGGCAIDIAAGGDGSLWVVGCGTSNSIWYWTGSTWAEIDGAVAHIAAGNDGTVYGAAADGSVWERIGGVSGSWQALGGCAVEIGVGSMLPYLWVLACGAVPGGWGIYYWGGSGWFAIDGGAVDIAVDHAGWPYIANSSAVFQRRK